jgi:hypothetical protein
LAARRCMSQWKQKTDASWQRGAQREAAARISQAHFNTEETMPTTYTNDNHTPTAIPESGVLPALYCLFSSVLALETPIRQRLLAQTA